MDDADNTTSAACVNPRSALSYGDTIGVFQVGEVQIKQRYACIRRDQFEMTAKAPFPPAFRDFLAQKGPLRGNSVLYVLDISEAYQLTVAPSASRAVFVPRLATELDWQRKTVVELATVLDEILRSVGTSGI